MHVYCGVCSLPPEYCEFMPTLTKCTAWLESNHPDLFASLYASPNTDTATTPAKLKPPKLKASATPQQPITILHQQRNKRKSTTTLQNIHAHPLDLKKVAKVLSATCACGASVVKNAQHTEEIVVQGDVGDKIKQVLMLQFGIPETMLIVKNA